jgi:peptidoglycan/xylan/chitin deacetylase (PgdA/CDA1 family)
MLLPVLTYHAFGDRCSPLWTSTKRFEAHLAALAWEGYRAVGLSEALAPGAQREDRLVGLTVDDGYESFLRHAWPRLRERGWSATLFLVANHCGQDNRWPGQPAAVPRERLLTWEEAARLAGEGCELGAHSLTHAPLSCLAAAQVEEEICGSKEKIEGRTGAVIRAFSYPYGAITPAITAIVSRHFDAAVGTRLGLVSEQSDRFALPRIDAVYLNAFTISSLATARFAGYLRARQVLRSARRLFRPDWYDAAGSSHG